MYMYSFTCTSYFSRCRKEWELAVRLYHEGRQCEVIVAALEVCSRPPPLKQFLYLDFMDGTKFDTVWEKLVQKIRKGELYLCCMYMYNCAFTALCNITSGA